jgi:D-amino-acid dehydrogenase
MRVVILGAGVIGVNTAWQLLRRGHEVTLVDRQAAAALETSFANAGQISVSYCEPWASRQAPLKMVQWLFNPEGPLKFRPRLDPAQWRWGLQFLGQCHDAAFERNVAQLVALGRYSHAALQEVVAETGIRFDRLTKGIAHYYTDPRAFEEAAAAAELMRRHGVDRRVVDRDELLAIEPALRAFGDHIVGGTYTQQLAALCERRGMEACMGHDIERLLVAGGEIVGVQVRDRRTGEVKRLHGDAYVVACGSYTAPLLRQVGVRVPIYPGKGYSATLPLLRPDDAPQVSLLDDGLKIAISRLGDRLRVAGTIEVGGYDLSLDTPLARARARMLTRRIEQVFPGVADTRPPEEGGDPRFWCGLRPATPTNVPLIGRTPLGRLWINAGHGTLGWTHAAGSGKALAALIGGEIPALPFDFCGLERPRRAARPASLDPATPS